MTRWIDEPSWGDEITTTLLRELSNAIYHPAEMSEVWVNARLEPGRLPQAGTARTAWTAMLRDAHDEGRLEPLLEAAQVLRPVLRERLAPAFGELPQLHWYSCGDRYAPRMLGPGSRQALINRSKLSRNLENIVRDGYPVCNIRGGSGAGKSYSRLLIQHLAGQPDIHSQHIRVDIAATFRDGVNAGQFATWLADRLEMRPIAVDENTHATSIADALALRFLAQFPALPQRRRWIFIDGLDRPGVTDDVHVFVGQLALAAVSGELPDVRLFLTGHRGDFHSDVLDVLCEEDIDPIDRSHLIGFFRDIATHLGRPLDEDEAGALADTVLGRASLTDLRALGRAAGAVAIEQFKEPPDGR